MGYGVAMPPFLVDPINISPGGEFEFVYREFPRGGRELRHLCGPQDAGYRDNGGIPHGGAIRSAPDSTAFPGGAARFPGGAFYAFANVKATGHRSTEVADSLLNDAGAWPV